MSNQPEIKYALLLSDVVSLSIAYFLALAYALPSDNWLELTFSAEGVHVYLAYAMCLSLFLMIFRFSNLYSLRIFESQASHLLKVTRSVLIGTGISCSIMLLVGWQILSGHTLKFFLLFLAIGIALGTVLRLITVRLLRLLAENARGKRRLLVVGGDNAAHKVITAVEEDPTSFLGIVGVVDDYKEPGRPLFDGWQNLGRLDSIPEVTKTLQPDEILVAIDNAPYSRLVEVVETCVKTGCVVRVFSDRLESLARHIGAEKFARDIAVIKFSQTESGLLSRKLRRVVDVTIAALALVLLSPLLLAVCVGIKLSSPGPVIFRQTRIGLNGRPFDFYKFRSMHVGTSSRQHKEYVAKFIKGQAATGSVDELTDTVFKIADDPRVFPFGRFIRRTSIDEFPQLFNVLKGDMGLVSPRPCLPYEWESYEEWHKKRLSVVPGCTGLWQVVGRSAVTFEEMVMMDLYYIRNHSLSLDARILFKTISVVIFSKGGF